MSLGFADVAAWGTGREAKEGNRKEQWGKSKDGREKDDDTPVNVWVVSKEARGQNTHSMSWLTSILRNILAYIGLHTWLGWLPSSDDLHSLAWLNVHFFQRFNAYTSG